MEESLQLGIPTYWADVKSLAVSSQKGPFLKAQKLLSVKTGRNATAFRFASEVSISPAEFDRIVYRTDPPVDLAYLHPLQMIASAIEATPRKRGRAKPELVNSAETLFWANEKFESWAIGQKATPDFLISSREKDLLAYGKKWKQVVLKPLENAQSKGVELLRFDTPEERVRSGRLLKTATHEFSRGVLLQEYLPEILKGETRLWFINGTLLRWVRKKPKTGEFRVNMDQGGFLEECSLTSVEKQRARQIGKFLTQKRIRMAAVDLIAGKITDFNITSPGLLSLMEETLQDNLARPVLEGLQKDWNK